MYEKGYSNIFWGLIFIAFNIYIGFLNIMPNIIGFLFIGYGLKGLSEELEVYKKGEPISGILAVLSIGNIIKSEQENLISGAFQPIEIVRILGGAVYSILNIYLIYIICRGIYELTLEKKLTELNEGILSSWKWYFIISVFAAMCTPFAMNLSQDFSSLFIIAALANFVAQIIIIFMVSSTKKALIEQE